MTREVFTAALIGGGRIGLGPDPRAHALAYQSFPDTKLTAIADPDPQVRERAAAQGLEVYVTAEEMLAEVHPAIVSVCSPTDTHADMLKLLLKSDVRGVLLEKPVALTVADAEPLLGPIKRSTIVVGVNYSRRYAPHLIALRRLIADGQLGPIVLVRGLYSKGLLLNGSHWLDLARWLVGPFTVVNASWRLDDGRPDDSTLDVFVHFVQGGNGVLHGVDHRSCDHFEMDILGTRGRARITAFGDVVEIDEVEPLASNPGYRQLVTKRTHRKVMDGVTTHAVVDLVDAVRSGRKPACTFEDGLEALRAVEMARTAAGLTS